MRMSDEQWFYCLKHHTVEGPDGCRAADRLGPYPDKETASRALEIARERTEAADRADARVEGARRGPSGRVGDLTLPPAARASGCRRAATVVG